MILVLPLFLAFLDLSGALRLEPQKEEFILSSRSTWEIKCSGKYPLDWDYPGSGQVTIRNSSVTISHVVTSKSEYTSVLRLKEAHYLDTGYYFCKYANTTDQNEVVQAQTYLYVYNPQHLFAYPADTSVVDIHEKESSILGCKPTHPDIQISFYDHYNNQIRDLSRKNLDYDPKLGLIVTMGHKVQHRMLKQITCKAEYKGKVQEMNVVIRFHEEVIVHKPTIQKSQPEHPIKGQDLVFDCRAHFDQRVPTGIELIWKTNNSARYKQINATAFADPRYKNRLILSRKLVIHNLQKEDENKTLSCYMKGRKTVSSASKTTVGFVRNHHQDPYFSHVKFYPSPELNLPSSFLGAKEVYWVFDVFASPKPEYRWIDPKGNDVPYNILEKYEVNFNGTKHKYKLYIHDLKLEDMGHYVFEISVEGETKQIDMYLNIQSDPNINLKPQIEEFYLENSLIDFNCTVLGYPIDEQSLIWTFQKCQDFDNCSDNGSYISPELYSPLVPSDGNIRDGNHYKYESTLPMTIKESGILSCKVCSPKNVCDVQSTSIFVNDYSHEGFVIEELDEEPIIEEDEVILTCAGSKYKYDNVTWSKDQKLKAKKEQPNPSNLIQDSPNKNPTQADPTIDALIVKDFVTDFSLVSQLTFKKIGMEQSGSYSCHGILKTPNQDEPTKIANDLTYDIKVLNKIPPKRGLSFNMNEEKRTPYTGEIVNLDCSISEGRPKPLIKWTKNGKPFRGPTENSSYELTNDNSTISFSFVRKADSGVYECSVQNRAGTITGKVKLEVKESIPTFVIALCIIGSLLVLGLSILLAWKVRVYNRKYKKLTAQELKMFENGDPSGINPEMGVDDQADLLPYNKGFEFPTDKLKFGKQLGSGAFGRVVKADAMGINPMERSTVVAVKMVKPNADIMYVRALMSELKIMIHLGKHLNIVNLLGACTKGLAKKELFVIVEYCRFGNLQKYLLRHRHHYINQCDPVTGEINFNIGQDLIDGYGNDFARAREEEEMSVYIKKSSICQSTGPTGGACTSSEPTVVRKKSSVRYVPHPKKKRSRTISIESAYSAGQQVNTDMTTVTEEEEDDSVNKPFVERSQSVTSRASQGSQGPGWRANMKGDYDVTNVKPIATKDLLGWGYQVTRGMEYLASKKVMHGDLACRNILLAADNVVKICDFGLAKDIYKNNTYQKKSDGPLPVKWMAIESIRDRVFSTQSDVWAFGVVLWEMFSLGKSPYPGIEACDLYNMLINEHRMEKPEYCPQPIYDMMLHTWDSEPEKRPNFLQLMDELGDLLEEGETDHYLDLTKNFDASFANNAVENKDYLAMMSPPDFTTQTSVSPGDFRPQTSVTSAADLNGYLEPTKPTTKKPTNGSVIAFDNDDYLMPNGKSTVIEMTSLTSKG